MYMSENLRKEAYLDIETTGLHPHYNEITVVGIYITQNTDSQFIQLIGEKICGDAILQSLEGVDTIILITDTALFLLSILDMISIWSHFISIAI